MDTIKGTYRGDLVELQGETALVQLRQNGFLVAQFDNLKLEPWCFGWHEFPRSDFELPDLSSWCGDDSSPFRHLYDADGF